MKSVKNKSVLILSLIMLFAGLITNSRAYFLMDSWIHQLVIIKPLSLYFGWITNYFEVWETIIYLILFSGLFFYIRTKEKETRLLSFAFSVIFINNIVLAGSAVISLLYLASHPISESDLQFRPKPNIVFITLLVKSFYIFASFSVLSKIKTEKGKFNMNEFEKVEYTGKWHRFFHLLVDSLVIVLTFTALVSSLLFYFEKNQLFQNYFNNYFGLVIIAVFVRLIFYSVFEHFFGATPAKFLTHSVVVDKNGNRPKLNVLLKRSFCRSIPFDAVSFLGKSGWHDSLSETRVVKEKTEGINPKQFLWILVLIVPFLSYNLFIKELISHYQYSKVSEREENYQSQWYNNSRKNLNTNQFYVLEAVNSNNGEYEIGLKIEDIKPDSLKVKKIKLMSGFPDFGANKRQYENQKDTAKTFVISRKTLENSIPKHYFQKYEDYLKQEIFGNGIKYNFKNVFELNVPNLEVNNTTFDTQQETKKNSGKIFLGNAGKSGQIISIKNIKGEMVWKDHFPIAFGASKGRTEDKIAIQTNYKSEIKNNIAELKVSDSLNHLQKYILEIDEYRFNIFRVE